MLELQKYWLVEASKIGHAVKLQVSKEEVGELDIACSWFALVRFRSLGSFENDTVLQIIDLKETLPN